MNEEQTDDGAEQTQEEKDAQAAFDAGFAGTRATGPLIVDGTSDADSDALEEAAAATARAPRKRAKPAAASAPASAEGDKGNEPAAVDPFAGLPEPVREALARVTTIEHDVRAARESQARMADKLAAAEGRIAAFQRERETSQRQTPGSPAVDTPTPAPTHKMRERVRGELPEVAEALDELDAQLIELRKQREARDDPPATAKPAASTVPTPAAATAEDGEADALAALDPDWGTKMESTAFKLWTSTLPENDRQSILGTDKAIVLAGYLKKFDKFSEGVETRNRDVMATSARRDNRTARAAAPPSGGSRGLPTKELTADEAFEQGFNRIRTGVA